MVPAHINSKTSRQQPRPARFDFLYPTSFYARALVAFFRSPAVSLVRAPSPPLIPPLTFGFAPDRWSLYSTESTSACQLASTTLSDTPTVPHRVSPSVDSINTRTRASVPAPLSST